MEQRKIKILFLIDVLYWGGGTESHLAYVVSRLDRTKFDCMVCTVHAVDDKAPSVVRIREAGIPCVSLNLKRAYSPFGLIGAIRLARLLKKNQIDVVQTFHFVSDTFGVMAARLAGVPTIISSRRDMDSLNTGIRRIARQITAPLVTHFIAVCNAVARNFSDLERVPPSKITTIYNGVELSRFSLAKTRHEELRSSLGLDENAFVIGNVSVFRPVKDYRLFFAALRRIAPRIPNLKALAVGPGPLKATFEAECAKDEILRDVVIFTGGVSNVSDHIALMDVACLCPSENEGLSNAILEEMALGKPVVATDVGGNAELVVNGETGFIVPARDVDALASALLRLYQSPAERDKMGQRARERAERHFALEHMIHNMERFYEQVHQPASS